MELTDEIIKAQGFSEEQVAAINGYVAPLLSDTIANTKKEYDGIANTQAEGIINGAIKATQDKNGVTLERMQGEKLGDWQARYSVLLNESKQSDLDAKRLEYEDKVKNFKGDPEVAKQILDLKDKLDGLQKKEAEYDTLLGSGVQDKYIALKEKIAAQDKQLAFSSVKPTFSQDANEFEVNAKWDAFKSEVLTKYDIVLVEGEAIAVDKDNEHKTVKLKDLVVNNNVLTELTKGRQQDGIDATSTDRKEVEGVPFKVPTNGDSGDLTKAVQEQLAKEGINKLDTKYTEKFKEYFIKAKEGSDKLN